MAPRPILFFLHHSGVEISLGGAKVADPVRVNQPTNGAHGDHLMPGFLLHSGATVLFSHGGSATPPSPSPGHRRGQPIATLPAPWMVAGCPS